MQERGGQWPDVLREAIQSRNTLKAVDRGCGPRFGKAKISILDVGSGPVAYIGYKLEGVAVQLKAVDLLASIYGNLRARYGLHPSIAPTFAAAEELSSFFELNSFDIAHCRSALDHSFDPLRGIIEMLRAVRVGGFVLLRHHPMRQNTANIMDFHHDNFDCRDGRFVVWNKSIMVDVADFLAGQAEVECATPLRRRCNP
jgi:SAM-dependent methyltransferase